MCGQRFLFSLSLLFHVHSLCLFLCIPFPSTNPLSYSFTQLMIFSSSLYSRCLWKKKEEIEACKREQLRTSALQVRLYTRLKIFLFLTLFVGSLSVSFFLFQTIFLCFLLSDVIQDIIKYDLKILITISEHVFYREFISVIMRQSSSREINFFHIWIKFKIWCPQ
jgi:hypothetical protein